MNGETAVKVSKIISGVILMLTGISQMVSGVANQYLIDKAVDRRFEEHVNRTED